MLHGRTVIAGFPQKLYKTLRAWRERPQRFSAKSMVWVLFRANELAARQRANIDRAFPEGLVVENPGLMASLTLRDPDYRHVLAEAIQTKAALIVTQNLKDYPPESLAPHEIEAISTDDFFGDCIDLAGIEAVAAFRRMRERFQNPQIYPEALILRIEQLGLGQTAIMLGEYRAVL